MRRRRKLICDFLGCLKRIKSEDSKRIKTVGLRNNNELQINVNPDIHRNYSRLTNIDFLYLSIALQSSLILATTHKIEELQSNQIKTEASIQQSNKLRRFLF